MRSTQWLTFASVMGLLTLPGCNGDPEVLGGTWVEQSSGVSSLYSHPGAEHCPQEVARLDRLASALADELGVEPPPRIEYYFASADEVQRFCERPFEVEGCADVPNGLAIAEGPNVHELVHLVANRGLTKVLPLISEGIAAYYGSETAACVPTPFDPLAHLTAQDDILVTQVFVGYLIERYGAEVVMELHRRSTADLTAEEFGSLFREVVGESVGEVATAAEQEGYCARSRFADLHGYGDAVGVRPGTRLTREASCEAGALGRAVAPVLVDLLDVEDTAYQLDARGSGQFVLEGWDPLVLASQSDKATTFFLRRLAGQALLRVSGASVDLEFSEVVLQAACDPLFTGAPAIIPQGQERVVLPDGPFALAVRFASAGALTVAVGSDLSLCDQDCVCAPLEGAVAPVDSQKPFWIVGPMADASPRSIFITAGG